MWTTFCPKTETSVKPLVLLVCAIQIPAVQGTTLIRPCLHSLLSQNPNPIPRLFLNNWKKNQGATSNITDGLLFPDSCVEETQSRQPSLSRAGVLPPQPGAGVSARVEEDGTRPGVPPAPTVRAGGEPLLAELGP